MELTVETTEAGVDVRVSGDLDVNNAYDLYLTLIGHAEGDRKAVVLDLSGVGFIDSVGLGMLVRSRDELSQAGARLRLRDPSPRVSRMLELTALTNSFDIAR